MTGFSERLNAIKQQQAQAVEAQAAEKAAVARAELLSKQEAISQEIATAEAAAAEAQTAIAEADAFVQEQGAALDPEVALQVEQLRNEAGETIARLEQLRAEASEIARELAALVETGAPAQTLEAQLGATPTEEPEASGAVESGGAETPTPETSSEGPAAAAESVAPEAAAEVPAAEVPPELAAQLETAREQWENAERKVAKFAGYIAENEAALARLDGLKNAKIMPVSLPALTLGGPEVKVFELTEESDALTKLDNEIASATKFRSSLSPNELAASEASEAKAISDARALVGEVTARGGKYLNWQKFGKNRLVLDPATSGKISPRVFEGATGPVTLEEAYAATNEELRGLVAKYAEEAANIAATVANLEQSFGK